MQNTPPPSVAQQSEKFRSFWSFFCGTPTKEKPEISPTDPRKLTISTYHPPPRGLQQPTPEFDPASGFSEAHAQENVPRGAGERMCVFVRSLFLSGCGCGWVGGCGCVCAGVRVGGANKEVGCGMGQCRGEVDLKGKKCRGETLGVSCPGVSPAP